MTFRLYVSSASFLPPCYPLKAKWYYVIPYKEKGKKLILATLKVKTAKGDTVEFPDSQPKEWQKDGP